MATNSTECPSGTFGCDCTSISVWQQEGGYQALVAIGTISILIGFIILNVGAVVRVLVPDPSGAARLVLGVSSGQSVNVVQRRLLRAIDAAVALLFLIGALLVASALSSPLRQGGTASRSPVDYSSGIAFAWTAVGLASSALGLAVAAIFHPRGCCTGANVQFLHVALFRAAWVVCVWAMAAQVNPDFGATVGALLILYAAFVAVAMFLATRAFRSRYVFSANTELAIRNLARGAVDQLEGDEDTVSLNVGGLRRLQSTRTGDGAAAVETAMKSLRVALFVVILGAVDVIFFAVPGTVVFMRVGCTWGQ